VVSIDALCDDWDRYYEERGGSPNHTAAEERQIARWPKWDGYSDAVRAMLNGPDRNQFPPPTQSREEAIAGLREAVKWQKEGSN